MSIKLQKRIMDYSKNVAKSTVYTAADILGDKFSAVKDFNETNQETFNQIYKSVKDYRIQFRKLKSTIRNSQVVQGINVGIDSMLYSIKTGDFYGKSKEEEVLNKYGGEAFDLSGWDIDNEEFDWQDNDDITDGEKIIATAVKKNSKLQTAITSEAIVHTGKSIIDSNKENYLMLYLQNKKIYSKLDTGFENITNFLVKKSEHDEEIQSKQIENTNKFFTNVESLLNKMTAQMDEIVKLQRSAYGMEDKVQGSKTKRVTINDVMSSSGMVNIGEYAKQVKKNIKEEIDNKLAGIFSTNEALGGNLFANYFSTLPRDEFKKAINKLIPKKLDRAADELNESLTGIFSTLIAKFNSAGNNTNNPIAQMLGKMFGIRTNKPGNSVDTSRYKKGAIPFDGITKVSITEVIPRYLRKITSFITGEDEMMFDYNSGSWKTLNSVHSGVRNLLTSANNSTKNIIFKIFNDSLGTNYSNVFKDSYNKNRFESNVEILAKLLNNNDGDFSVINNSELNYELDKDFIKALKTALQDNEYDLTEEDTGIRSTNKRIKKINGLKTGKNNRAFLMNLAKVIQSNNNSVYNRIKRLEENIGGDPARIIFSEGLSGIDTKNFSSVGKTKYGDIDKESIRRSPISNALLITKDKHGNSIYDYLAYIKKDLTGIRKNMHNGTNNNNRRNNNNNNNYDSSNLMDFEKPNYKEDSNNAPERFLLLYNKNKLEEDKRMRKNARREMDRYKERSSRGDNVDKPIQIDNMEDLYKAILESNINAELRTKREENRKAIDKKDKSIYKTLFDWGIISDDTYDKFNDYEYDNNKKLSENLEKVTGFQKLQVLGKYAKSLAEKPMEYATTSIIKMDIWLQRLFFGEDLDTKNDNDDDPKSLFGIIKQKFTEGFADLTTKLSNKMDDIWKDKIQPKISKYLDPLFQKLFGTVGNDQIRSGGLIGDYIGSVQRAFKENHEEVKRIREEEKRERERKKRERELRNLNSPTDNLAKGGINKTGKAFNSVVSSGEIINGNVVPPGGPYIATIPKNGIVINPAESSVRSKQAIQEKAFARHIRKNAEVNDGLSKVDKMDLAGQSTARGLVGGGAGLLLGHPIIGAALGIVSAFKRKSTGFSNALFGDAIQLDDNGNVIKRNDNGIISQAIQKSIPDAGKFGLIGTIAGLLTPFGPVGGLLVGSALGFVKNNELVKESLFGDNAIFENTDKIKKALPAMGIGAGVGALLGPFGLVGNILVGAAGGFATTTDKFKEVVLGKEGEDGKREGGIIGTIKKGFAPLKDFGNTMTNKLLEAILGEEKQVTDKNGNTKKTREGGLVGTLKDLIAKPFLEGIGPIIQASKNMVQDIKDTASNIIRKIKNNGAGNNILEKVFHLAGIAGKGAVTAGKGALLYKLAPVIGAAQGVKYAGRALSRSMIRKGKAYNMTAAERLDRRKKDFFMGPNDEYSDIDRALLNMSDNSTVEQMETLKDRVSFAVNGKQALEDEDARIRSRFVDQLSNYMGYKDKNRLVKMMNSKGLPPDYAEMRKLINGHFIKNKKGEDISDEDRNQLLKYLDDMISDRKNAKERFNNVKNAGKITTNELKEMGLDINLNNQTDVNKLVRNLDTEIQHKKAGLTDEEKEKQKKRKEALDPNNPLNKNTNKLEEINTTLGDIIRALTRQNIDILKEKYNINNDKISNENKTDNTNSPYIFGGEFSNIPNDNDTNEDIPNQDKLNPNQNNNESKNNPKRKKSKRKNNNKSKKSKNKKDKLSPDTYTFNIDNLDSDTQSDFIDTEEIDKRENNNKNNKSKKNSRHKKPKRKNNNKSKKDKLSPNQNNETEQQSERKKDKLSPDTYTFNIDNLDSDTQSDFIDAEEIDKRENNNNKNIMKFITAQRDKSFDKNDEERFKKYLDTCEANWSAKIENIEPDADGYYRISFDGKDYVFNESDQDKVYQEYVKDYIAKRDSKLFSKTPKYGKIIATSSKGFIRKIKSMGIFKTGLLVAAASVVPGGVLGWLAFTNSSKLRHKAYSAVGRGVKHITKYAKFRSIDDKTKNKMLNKELDKMSPEEYASILAKYKNEEGIDDENEAIEKWREDRGNELSETRVSGGFGIGAGVRNKVVGAKENVDKKGKEASTSDKLITAITSIPQKIGDAFYGGDDEKKEGFMHKFLRKVFGVAKWVIGVPLVVGMLNDTIVPFLKNKVKPIMIGEKNSQTGMYEGGILSGVLNPIVRFFGDKLQGVHDWFFNDGKYNNEYSGMKGVINNLKGVGMYLYDKWKSGLSTILTTVVPGALRTIIGNIPEIVTALGGAIVGGISDLFKKHWSGHDDDKDSNQGDTSIGSLVDSGNSSSNSSSSSDSSSDYPTNNTVGSKLSIFPKVRDVGIDMSWVDAIKYKAGKRSDVGYTTNEDGTINVSNSEGESTTSEIIDNNEMYSAGKNKNGDEIFYKKSDTHNQNPYIYKDGQYYRADQLVNVADSSVEGNTQYDEMISNDSPGQEDYKQNTHSTIQGRFIRNQVLRKLSPGYRRLSNAAITASITAPTKVASKVLPGKTTRKVMGKASSILDFVASGGDSKFNKEYKWVNFAKRSAINDAAEKAKDEAMTEYVKNYFAKNGYENTDYRLLADGVERAGDRAAIASIRKGKDITVDLATEAAEKAARETFDNYKDKLTEKELSKLMLKNAQEAGKKAAYDYGIDKVKEAQKMTAKNAVKGVLQNIKEKGVKGLLKEKASNVKDIVKEKVTSIKPIKVGKSIYEAAKEGGIKGVGNLAKEGLKDTAKNGLQVVKEGFTNNKIVKGTKGIIKGGKAVFNAAKRGGVKDVGKLGVETGKGIVKSLKDKITDILYKIFGSNVFKKVLKEGGQEMSEEALKKTAQTVGEKAAKEAGEQVTKAAGKAAGKTLGGVLTAGILPAATVVYDFVTGMSNARNILQITSKEIDWSDKIIAGISKVLAGLTIIIPETMWATIIIKILGPILFKKKAKELEQERKDSEAALAAYNSAHNTNYTMEEYNNKFNATWYTKAVGGVKNFGSHLAGTDNESKDELKANRSVTSDKDIVNKIREKAEAIVARLYTKKHKEDFDDFADKNKFMQIAGDALDKIVILFNKIDDDKKLDKIYDDCKDVNGPIDFKVKGLKAYDEAWKNAVEFLGMSDGTEPNVVIKTVAAIAGVFCRMFKHAECDNKIKAIIVGTFGKAFVDSKDEETQKFIQESQNGIIGINQEFDAAEINAEEMKSQYESEYSDASDVSDGTEPNTEETTPQNANTNDKLTPLNTQLTNNTILDMGFIKTSLTKIIELLSNNTTSSKNNPDYINVVKNKASNVLNKGKEKFNDIKNYISNIPAIKELNKNVSSKVDSIKNKVSDAKSSMKNSTSNLLNTIGQNMSGMIDNIPMDKISNYISGLVNKNIQRNKKIDTIDLTPDQEEYWKIDADSKDPFANALYKFNEFTSRLIRAPYALVTRTMANSNSILTTNAQAKANSSSVGNSASVGATGSTTATGGNSNSSANKGSASSSSKGSSIFTSIKNTGKKLWSWLTGKGKDSNDSGYGGTEYDPYHIYQRDYKGSFNINGDTEKQSVADSGCGPAAAASVLRMYGKQGSMNNAVNYALNGYKEVNGGTYPQFFNDYLNKNGISAKSDASNKDVINNLKNGKPVILMGKDKSNSGKTPYGSKYSHYVVAKGLDNNGNVIVEDSEDKKGSTKYKLSDTLNNSSIKITTGEGKYGRGEDDNNMGTSFINNMAGMIAGMTSNAIGGVVNGLTGLNTSSSKVSSNNNSNNNNSNNVTINGDVMEGTEISVPSDVQAGITKNYTNYDYWFPKWARSCYQGKIADLWDSKGRTKDKGIAVLDGYYLIAMTPKFGTTGDLVSVILEDGTVINCLLADSKGSDCETEWGHYIGGNGKVDVIEWEACCGSSSAVGTGADTLKIDSWIGKKVSKVINGGSYFDKETSGSGKFGRGILSNTGRNSKLSMVSENFITNSANVLGQYSRNVAMSALLTLGGVTDTANKTNKNTNNIGGDISDPGDTEGRKKAIWEFFTSHGVSDNLTAVIMGNMQRESNFDPTISERGSGVNMTKVEDLPHSTGLYNGTGMGFGLIQWSFAGGHAALYNWCTGMGFDPNTLAGQVNYILDMIKDGPNMDKAVNAENTKIFGTDGAGVLSFGVNKWVNTYGGFNKINNESMDQANNAFYWSFEIGPAFCEAIGLKNAKEIYNQFAGGGDSSGSGKYGRGASSPSDSSYIVGALNQPKKVKPLGSIIRIPVSKSRKSNKKSKSLLERLKKYGLGKLGRAKTATTTAPNENKSNTTTTTVTIPKDDPTTNTNSSPNPSADTSKPPASMTKPAKHTTTTTTKDEEKAKDDKEKTDEETNEETTDTTEDSKSSGSNGGYLLSKMGSYSVELLKKIYGPYWDALFGEEETQNTNNGSANNMTGDLGTLVHAAAEVFDGMGAVTYSSSYKSFTTEDGFTYSTRPDCSGMMAATINYLGYKTYCDGVEAPFTSHMFELGYTENGTTVDNAIRNGDGSKTSDWIVMPYDKSKLQPGDIVTYNGGPDDGHIEMYLWTTSDGKYRGFNAGGTISIADSVKLAKYVLEKGTYEGATTGGSIGLENDGRTIETILRYVGGGSGDTSSKSDDSDNKKEEEKEDSGSGKFGRGKSITNRIKFGRGISNTPKINLTKSNKNDKLGKFGRAKTTTTTAPNENTSSTTTTTDTIPKDDPITNTNGSPNPSNDTSKPPKPTTKPAKPTTTTTTKDEEEAKTDEEETTTTSTGNTKSTYLLSKMGSYSVELLKKVYGPYWDALFGEEETQNTNDGSNGSYTSGSGVIYAAAMVFEAMGKANPDFCYCFHGGRYLYDLTCRDGKVIEKVRADCSGMMSAVAQYMGYDTASSGTSGNFHGYGLSTYNFLTSDNSKPCFYKNGSLTDDWKVMKFDKNDRQPGDMILRSDMNHIDMYVFTDTNGRVRGFNGGSGTNPCPDGHYDSLGSGLEDSYKFGCYYLDNGNKLPPDDGSYGATTIKDEEGLWTIRYVGDGSTSTDTTSDDSDNKEDSDSGSGKFGRGNNLSNKIIRNSSRAKGHLSKESTGLLNSYSDTIMNRGDGLSSSNSIQSYNKSNKNINYGKGKGGSNYKTLLSPSSNKTSSSSSISNKYKNYSSSNPNSTIGDYQVQDSYDNTQFVNTSNINLDAVLGILQIIADNSAKNDQIIQLLAAIVTNTNNNDSKKTNISNSQQLLNLLNGRYSNSNNNSGTLSALQNLLSSNSNGSNIANAVYSIAKS